MKKLNWLGLILTLVMCLALVPAQAETMTKTVESGNITVDSPYTNDELFALYVQGEMDKAVYGDAAEFGTLGRDRLKTDAQKALYDELKAFFGMVAKGSSRSTVYTVDLSKLGVEYEFTNTSLGVDAIFADGTWNILPEAQEKIDEATIKLFADLGLPCLDLGLTEAPLMDALMHDCPSELYWFDKTYGYSIPYVIGVSKSGSAHTYKITEFKIQFPVSEDYLSGQVTDYTIMTSRVSAVKTALENAQAIVDKHASKSDEEKLRAYMEEICALVSYNDDAADDSTNTPYGDPWQLVYVFDGNTYTNVVCEGYSKAFQYLCDLSDFDQYIYCYSVSGIMTGGTGAGRHMWNIVQTPDGNYLVDVTNCDEGTVGSPDELFMQAEATGAWNTQYTLTPNGQTIIYEYDDDAEALWGEEVLKLGEKHTHDWKLTYVWDMGKDGPELCFLNRKCACGAEENASTDAITSVVDREATCTTTGQITYTATFEEEWAVPGTNVVETAIDPDNHAGPIDLRGAKEPTCSQQGSTGSKYCTACKKFISNGVSIPATGEHKYTVEVEGSREPATCMATGSVTMKCATCTATEVQTLEKDPDNHTGVNHTENASEASCGVAGYTGDTHCECGVKIADGEVIPALEHNYQVVEGSEVLPTCKTPGSITKKCSACGNEKDDPLAIDPYNHAGEVETRNMVAATCSADGYSGDVYCLDCSSMITKGEVVAATGEHVYGKIVGEVTPTCTQKGSITTQCNGCDATTTEDLGLDASNHEGGTEVRNGKASDCGNDGYTGDTYCLGCNAKIADGETIPATGAHNYADEVEGTRTPATCMDKGSVTMKCTGCDATEDKELAIDPANHTKQNTTVKDQADATCGNDGYTGDTYCECGEKIADGEAIPATGNHNYTEEVSRVASTCKTAGSVTKKCGSCTATTEETLALDASNHEGGTEVRNAKSPDCANNGYTGDTYCLGCNAKIKDGETISATGKHNFASEVAGTRVDATCMTKGSVTMQCTGCDATEEQTLPIDRFNHTGNTTTENAAEPTCGAEGYTGDTYCECGMVIKMGQPIPATEEHDFTEIVEGSEVTPTCKTEGSLTLKCANCEATSVDKLGYDPANHEGGTELRNAKAPDCANAGYTGDTHCLGCGEKLKDGEPIPANGEHSYTIEVEGTRIPSTCKTPGKVTMQCSGCTDTEEQTLPVDPANHEGETEVRGAKEATCTEDGYTGDTYCLGCETVIEEGEAIPAGHEDEDGDGICDNCPAVLAYRIDIAPAEGGSASASSEKAAAGEEVIITLTPEDGMEMEYLVVVLADGRTITPRLVSENRYTFIQPEGDVTVHAFFKAIPVDQKVTVTFHANGGVGVMMPVQVTSGQPYTLPECAFLPAEGYAFKGWALTADGPVLPQSVTVGGSIDLYAIWQLEGASVPVPPATGDNANINLWLVMMALSAACIVYLLTGRKRKA